MFIVVFVTLGFEGFEGLRVDRVAGFLQRFRILGFSGF